MGTGAGRMVFLHFYRVSTSFREVIIFDSAILLLRIDEDKTTGLSVKYLV